MCTPTPWHAVFGNDRPVEVEIGPGRGDVLLAYATARPGTNFFGIERHWGPAEAILARARAQGLTNVRAIGADARCVIAGLVPPASVAAYHIYFPDPWPKNRHRDRRLADAAFARALRTSLAPGGVVHVATDVPNLLALLARSFAAAGLAPRPDLGPDPARPRTTFERKYAGDGTHHACFTAADT